MSDSLGATPSLTASLDTNPSTTPAPRRPSASKAPQWRSGYRLSGMLAVATALLFATQEPFSALAAKGLDANGFVFLTQVSLLLSVPLLLIRRKSRKDFFSLIGDRANYLPMAVIFAIGIGSLLLYDIGLSKAHPIIIAAVLNLSPFWAGLAAKFISGVAIPARPLIFFGCFLGAFAGALVIAWSQLAEGGNMDALAENFFHGGWIYALPVPLLSALNGTLIAKWFGRYDESAAIAANFIAPAAVLIPLTGFFVFEHSGLRAFQLEAIGLMLVGTILAASIGRVVYQTAISAARGDNGYVSMFLLLTPPSAGVISFAMSFAIPSLKFSANALYFVGLGLIGLSLLVFSWRAWLQEGAEPPTRVD